MKVLAIVGPTASGKTPLSLLLAERLGSEIVSADSRQIYRYLDIGTAKPSASDLNRVPHHLIDMLDPKEEYNAGQYGKDARRAIVAIYDRKRTPLLVGGSGLYVSSVIDGLFEDPGRDPEIRFMLEGRLKEEGLGSLLQRLKEVDHVSFEVMKKEPKARRVIRALEIFYMSGKPISEFHREQAEKTPWQATLVALNWPREQLYAMINERVDRMVERGLREEVESLQSKGFDRSLNSLNTVGYKEMWDHLEGRRSLDETVELIKRNTRRFAKRQLTWFRRDKRIKWFDMKEETDVRSVAEEVERFVRKEEKTTAFEIR